MNTQPIESGFAQLGARVKVREIPSRWTQGDRSWISPQDYSLDIQRDGKGEFFELLVPTHLSEALDVTVMQSEPKQRHLLLFVRKHGDKPQLDRFLCGHDEREWFVAAVPGGASSVRQAMDALQPAPVLQALASHKVSTNKRYSRKNRAFRRQGEWFFVPEPTMAVDPKLVLRNEPLRRGAGKPHMVEQLFRTGGETVYVSSRHPNGLLPAEYIRWAKVNRGLLAQRFVQQIGAEANLLWDGCHNSITPRQLEGETIWVHRKGAVAAESEAVVIPGSRGSLSYLVKPLGDGESHAWSLAHGAGRKWARSEARQRMRERFGMHQLTQTSLGGRVICEERDLLYEEAPAAYKNIEDVIEELVDAGLASVIATFRPLLTYKTRALRR